MLALMEPTQSAVRVISSKAALREAVVAGLPSPGAGEAAAVGKAVLALPEVATAACVAAYASLGAEIDTRPLLDALLESGRRVVLPLLRADLGLDWGDYTGWAELRAGPRGTREPAGATAALADADVVVVPALAVDRDGHRLGRGGGSYDRALAVRRAGATVVAVVADAAVVAAVPVAAHDVPVDVVVTPTQILRCPPGRTEAAYD